MASATSSGIQPADLGFFSVLASAGSEKNRPSLPEAVLNVFRVLAKACLGVLAAGVLVVGMVRLGVEWGKGWAGVGSNRREAKAGNAGV